MEEQRKDETGFFSAYGRMWKKGLNFKDTATPREYWFPVIVNVLLSGLILLIGTIAYEEYSVPLEIVTWVLFLYLIVSTVPFAALTVRRLRAVGRKGWWTVLLLLAGVGALVLLFLCLDSAASGYNPIINHEQNVYGPPPWDDPSENINGDVYGPPDWFEDSPEYEPDENLNECVYGPPEWFNDDPGYEPDENYNEDVYGPPDWDWDNTVEDPEDELEVDPEYKPDINMNEVVYGPPEWFEDDPAVQPEDEPAPETDYEVDNNLNEDVYGPPDWFTDN